MLDNATRTNRDAIKTASKKVVYERTEVGREFIGIKIADKIVKQKPISDMNWRTFEEIVILPKKREKILNKLRQSLKSGTVQNIQIIKGFNYIKVCGKNMDRIKWFIRWSIFC